MRKISYFSPATVLATLASGKIHVNWLRINSGWKLKEGFKLLRKQDYKTTFY